MSGEDKPEIIDYAAAVALLKRGRRIHTFRQGGPMLIGADWTRGQILKALKKAKEIHVTGPAAQGMGHGLAIFDEGGPLFIETERRSP